MTIPMQFERAGMGGPECPVLAARYGPLRRDARFW